MARVLILPFLASTSDTSAALLRYLAEENPYLPEDFVSAQPRREAIYVPAYSYRVSWKVNWTAQFGNYRTEHYTTWDNHHLHTGKHKPAPTPHNHARRVTDWRFGGGVDEGIQDLLGYAGKVLPVGARSVVIDSDPDSAIAADTSTLKMRIEKYAMTSEELWKHSVKSRADASISASVMKFSQGDVSKDWHWSGTITKDVTPLLCPVEAYAIEYKGEKFTFWVNGHNLLVDHGHKLPKDLNVMLNTHVGYALPGVAVIIALVFLADGSYGRAFIATAIAAALGFGAHHLRMHLEKPHSRKLLETFTHRLT